MRKKHVLIVEDSAIVQMDVQHKLKKLGYNEISTVPSGEKAIVLCREKPPDLVLMDINLTGEIDGIQAAEEITHTHDVPILYMSAYSDDETVGRAKLTKNYGFLVKPFDEKDMLTTIEIAFERFRYDKKLQESERKFRELFEGSRDPIFMADMEGRFLDLNYAMVSLFGYAREEMLTMKVRDLFEDLDVLKHLTGRINGENYVKDYECRLKRKDGSVIDCLVTANIQRHPEGSRYQGIIRDITEKKRAEEELNYSYQMIRKTMLGIVQAMAMALESRDPYTAGHQKRVSDLAWAIASEMGIEEHRLNGIKMAASIHDLGKISIPAEILSKPGKLAQTEFELIKSHPEIGYTILKDIEFPWPIQQIVLQHHEKIDGSGYPKGLTGDEMLLESKILCVADVVEAMASHRPYRAALGLESAMYEITEFSGTLYEPDVVEACVAVFEKEKFRLPLAI